MANNVNQQEKIMALLIAANPVSTRGLSLDEEIRAINEKIRLAQHRDSLELKPILAARPDDLLQYFNVYQPQVVQFSGHGNSMGEIILVDNNGLSKPVSKEAIKALFKIFKNNIKVVILNACYSQVQAKAIIEFIDCAIGMNAAIGNRAAITFVASFYRAIGFGNSVQDAFDQGRLALQLEGIPEENTPELLVKVGVDPSQIFLIDTREGIASLKESQTHLKRGQNALLRNDYASAKSNIEKAIEILDEDKQLEEFARAKFLLALALLNGKRPFSQTRQTMNSIENLLLYAIDTNRSYSYIFTLALFNLDFARNGFPHLARKAQELMDSVKLMEVSLEDKDNLKLLSDCQPGLFQDLLA